MIRARLITLVAACILWSSQAALATEIEDFFGFFVGTATVYDEKGNAEGQRHIDMGISSGPNDGFIIDLQNIILVDGKRDLPGVRRRAFTANFRPQGNLGLYLADTPYDPFSERREVQFFGGDPIEWAFVSGNSLFIAQAAILEDGRVSNQIYRRTLTETGLEMGYIRKIDGEVTRRVEGRLVRVD